MLETPLVKASWRAMYPEDTPDDALANYVVVSEDFRSEVEVTSHPIDIAQALKVPTASEIADHVFRKPKTLGLVLSFPPQQVSFLNLLQKLVDWQESGVLLHVETGKHSLSNMVLTSVANVTNNALENVLEVSLSLREVRIVSAHTTAAPAMPDSKRRNPEKTGTTKEVGSKQATDTEAKSSVLSKLVNTFKGQ